MFEKLLLWIIRKGLHAREQSVCLLNQAGSVLIWDRLIVELRRFQERKNLRRQSVALRCKRSELVLDPGIGSISGIAAFQAHRRSLQACQSQSTKWSVDLFERLGQKDEIAALLYRRGLRPAVKLFGERPTFVLVIVREADQNQHCGTNVRVVGPGRIVNSCLIHSRTNQSQPRCGDVWLKVAVIPRKSGLLERARGITVRRASKQEIVWIGKHDKRRRPCGIICNHVKQLHLHSILQSLRNYLSLSS